MAINFYAGLITKANDVETVETFVPFNIVKPVPFADWNEGKAYYYSDYPGELNSMPTSCQVKAFDEEPVDLMVVVKTLFGIDDSWTQGQYENLFNGNSFVNFFSEQDINSKLNFVLRLNSVAYQSESRIFARFQFGDISRAILFQWEANIGVGTVNNTILALGEEYSETSFESLLNAGKLIEQTNFTALTYDHFMNYPKYNLFMPMIKTSSDGAYSLAKHKSWQIGVNQFAINLSNWANWYTMLTGLYYYGNPYRFELLNPVKGIKYVDLGVPVLPNNQLAEGKIFNNTVVNNEAVPDKYIGFTYYNVGTDLYYLFSHDGVEGTETIALINGYLQRVVEGRNVIFRLLVEGKGLEFKNCGGYYEAKDWDVSFFDVVGDIYSFGSYIMVHKDWATLSVNEWLEQIPPDYSKYEYGNNPFFFATYSCGYEVDFYNIIKDNDYFDYEKYPDSRNPGLVTNYHYIAGSREYDMSVCNLEYPIDFEFWETFLTSLIEEPSGPNIGGGSIGGGNSSTGGGNGSFDDTSNNISQPTSLSGIAGTSGLFSMYTIGTATLNKIGDWLVESWTDEKKSDTINSKLQSIISFKQICAPGTPNLGNATQIKAFDEAITGAFGDVITSQYRTFNMGSYTFNEYFGSFLDYAPHTKISLYLPFVGIVSIDTNTVMGGRVTLSCGVDWISGNITYNLSLEKDNVKSVLNSWTGNSSSDIPLSQLDYSNKIAAEKAANISLLTMAGTTAAAGLAIGLAPFTGGMSVASGLALAGAVGGATINAAKQVSNYNMTEGQAASSLGGSGSAGFMNVKIPYFIIDRPVSSLPENYGHTNGYVSNVTKLIGKLTGYTEIAECNLNNFSNATEKEVNEIMSLLKSGVLL